MFSKLKERSFFRSLSGILCSVELVEVGNNIPGTNNAPQRQPLFLEEDGREQPPDRALMAAS
jgi:hypothetical protein